MSFHCRVIRLALLASSALLVATTSPAASENSTEWNFDVLLDGKPIGSHHFEVRREGNETSLLSDANFKVAVLSLTVYRYRHTSRELFRDDCLQRIEASTDENGVHEQVQGTAVDSAFVVTGHQGAARLPACVMTFDYWNPHILQQSHLLNPQTGAYTPVLITHLGPEILMVAGRSEAADTYLLAADALKIKLWYSADQRWLGLESTTADGKLMRYQLH
jgi:hypothetical protein